jgi:hypothetical protein
MMSPRVRKAALLVHVTLSVGWIGAVVAFLAIVGIAFPADLPALRAAWLAMDWIGWYAIVPLAAASLSTGIVMSLGTRWGLLRHYWTLISLVLTAVATAVLLGNMQTVDAYAALARDPSVADVERLREGLASEFLHAGLGLVVLMVIQVLNVYKPRGLTRYGHRRQAEKGLAPQP